MDTRRRARLLLLAVLVVVNGYAAQILWTFHLTEPVTMRIVVCEHHQRRSTCFGAPDAGGQTVSVSGATNSDRGELIGVRTGPLGTYADRVWVELIRVVPALAVDLGALVGFAIMVPARRRIRAQVESMRTEPGAWLLAEADDGRLTSSDGVRLIEVEESSGLARSPDGVPAFVLDRSDHGQGEPGVGVRWPAGTPLGGVQRGHRGTSVQLFLLDTATRALAVAEGSGGYFKVLDDRQRPVARLAWQGGRRWLLRIEHPVDEPLRTLLFAAVLEVHRLTGIRASRATSVGLGRGYDG